MSYLSLNDPHHVDGLLNNTQKQHHRLDKPIWKGDYLYIGNKIVQVSTLPRSESEKREPLHLKQANPLN